MTDRTFGVEIECFGPKSAVLEWALQNIGIAVYDEFGDYYGNGRNKNKWTIKDDGSIHAERNTWELELVSPILKGKKGIDTVKKVCAVLESLGYKTNKSCGLHVHVGAKGMTPNNVNTLIKRYNKHESSIDKFVTRSRRGNAGEYCKSTTKNVELISKALGDKLSASDIDAALALSKTAFRQKYGNTRYCDVVNVSRNATRDISYDYYRHHGYECYCARARKRLLSDLDAEKFSTSDLKNPRRLKQFMEIACGGGERYYKVNTAAYSDHGTIEFRHYHGTVNGLEIADWIRFILNFVEKSVKMSPAVTARATKKAVKHADPSPLSGLPTRIKQRFTERSTQLA